MRTFLSVLTVVAVVGACVALGAFGGCYTGFFIGAALNDPRKNPEPLNLLLPWSLGVGALGAGLGLAGGVWLAVRKRKG